MRKRVGRGAGALALVLVTLLVVAGPASADPAEPTNYRSEVTSVSRADGASVDGVRVDVIGGDAFLRIRVDPGHEVMVLGYDDEPYVRVLADGTVEQNAWSNAVALNDDRYGGADTAEVDLTAEPDWERVGDGGVFVWHDHRSHWMGKATPPQLGDADSGVVFDDWTVPLVVDGTAVTVHGTLVLDSAPSPLPWLAVGAVLAVAGAVVARRTDTVTALGAFLAVAALAALVVSATGQFGLPSDAGRQYHLVVIPAIAFVAAVASVVLRRSPSGVALVAGAALTLLLWVFASFGVLDHAHAPTDVAEGVQRAVLALALGTSLAAVLVGVAHEARSLRPR
jgi:hypothetical protein